MKDNNIIQEKSFAFAKRIVFLGKHLVNEHKDYNLSNQIVRCGTSIGANVFEAQNAQSKADFCSKMNIALKEATETIYWLMLLEDTHYISEKEYDSLFKDVNEIYSLLTAICKTSYKNI